eukprot:GHVS01042765.1.p1 GENE.GHVS01042765.1~~GHVS01042765.1.p1  ORF type:complete len:498 (+),score=85.48 GHVS01042765.1:280-1773(+)
MCAKLNSAGVCVDPDCSFAHSQEQLRHTDVYYKTKICVNWEKHRCLRGMSCRMAHGCEELRSRHTPTSEDNSALAVPIAPPRRRSTPRRGTKAAGKWEKTQRACPEKGGDCRRTAGEDRRVGGGDGVRLPTQWADPEEKNNKHDRPGGRRADRRCSQATTCAEDQDAMEEEERENDEEGGNFDKQDDSDVSWDGAGDDTGCRFLTHTTMMADEVDRSPHGEGTGRTATSVGRAAPCSRAEPALLLSPPERLYEDTFDDLTCYATEKYQPHRHRGPPLETLKNFLYVHDTETPTNPMNTDQQGGSGGYCVYANDVECTRRQIETKSAMPPTANVLPAVPSLSLLPASPSSHIRIDPYLPQSPPRLSTPKPLPRDPRRPTGEATYSDATAAAVAPVGPPPCPLLHAPCDVASCSAPFCFECFRAGVGGYGIGYYAAVGCLAGQTRRSVLPDGDDTHGEELVTSICPCCGLPHWLSSCLSSQYPGLICAPLHKLPEAYED